MTLLFLSSCFVWLRISSIHFFSNGHSVHLESPPLNLEAISQPTSGGYPLYSFSSAGCILSLFIFYFIIFPSILASSTKMFLSINPIVRPRRTAFWATRVFCMCCLSHYLYYKTLAKILSMTCLLVFNKQSIDVLLPHGINFIP